MRPPIFKHGRRRGAATLFPRTPKLSAALLTRRVFRALSFLLPRDFLPSPEPRHHRHGRHTRRIIIFDLGERWGGSADLVILAEVHSPRERHLGHVGAGRPPGEVDLRVVVLLRGGIPIRGHEPDSHVHYEKGFALPAGAFFHGLLHFYGLEVTHLKPN